MRKTIIALTAASALALGACQSKQADQVEDQAEAKADAIDAQADAMPEGPAKEATEARADAVAAADPALSRDGPGIDELTEYFLIGSFVSWLVALATLALVWLG